MARKSEQSSSGSGFKGNPYGNKPKVEPDDFGGKTAYIATIASLEWVNMAPGEEAEKGAEEPKCVLTYKEFPGKQHILNKTSYKSLVANLPKIRDKDGWAGDEWVGQRVPLVIVTTNDPRSHQSVEKVWVASLANWDAIMAKAKGGK